MLFVQRLQSLITFRGAALVKANIARSLQGSALEWYTSEPSDFDRDVLNNNSDVKSWVNTLSYFFKVFMSMAFGFDTNEIYSFNDAQAQRPSAQYVHAIMRHGIGCNIVDIANQLFFAYRGIAPKLRVFMLPSTELTKAANFIFVLEKKQEMWHKIMTTPTTSHRYYNPAWRLSTSPYRLFLLSQSKVFFRYQSQQRISQAQLPWQGPERPADLTQSTPIGVLQRQYSVISF